jgi:hypothetical protein
LRQANSPELDPWVNRTDYFYQVFRNQDAERLRGKFMRLNVFQDSWVPILKAGGYRGFELYDLSTDPKQEKNLAAQLPEVTARLKQEALKIVASVMAEGPDDWN